MFTSVKKIQIMKNYFQASYSIIPNANTLLEFCSRVVLSNNVGGFYSCN